MTSAFLLKGAGRIEGRSAPSAEKRGVIRAEGRTMLKSVSGALRDRLPALGGQRDLVGLGIFLLLLILAGLSFDLRPLVHDLFGAAHENCAFDGPFLLATLAMAGTSLFAWRRARENARQLAENCRLAESLEQALKRAHLADQTKTNLLAGMSHELRTPLNAILGFAELIRNDSLGKGVPDCYAAYADDIHRSGQTLLPHFDSILEYVSAETGEVTLSEEMIDLRTLFAGIQCEFASSAAAKGVALEVRLPSRSPGLLADMAALRQMLARLVGNAIRYHRVGGHVVVAAARDDAGGLFIRVEDDGPGIDSGRLVEAMHPFAVNGSGYTRSESGLGFGLALTRALAEMHGATLTLDSTPGEGTIASLRFPPARIFEKTERRRPLVAAARALDVTQPTVNAHIPPKASTA
ncbi:MAG: sensor histidine kinase [Alphaproteobacteria bacterium]|nr:MAG: sensor histidine kinase [Alphaproteobacteria bacterium]